MTDHGKRIERVRAHIRANLRGDLSLDALAEVAAMSRFHWHRVYRAATGETAWDAVRRERLNRAGVLVAMTALPLAAVARACGLKDADALGRAFRAAWGLTPREARARRLVPPALVAPGSLPANGVPAMFDVTIRADDPAELAALAYQGAYFRIGPTFEDLGRRLHAAGTPHRGPAYAIYYDDPNVTPAAACRAHAGVTIAPGASLPPGFDRVVVPGGRVAVYVHKGSYDGIAAAWDAMYRWFETSGEVEDDRPPFDRYLNGPDEVAPMDLLTEICVPLRG